MNLLTAVDTLHSLEASLPSFDGDVHLRGETLVIDNPSARGALTVRMMGQLGRHVLTLRASPPGVVLLRGTDGTFCSGGHLGQVRAGLVEPTAGAAMCGAMTVVLDALLTLPSVVVAVVDGPALGGGAELLTAADHRVFAPHAKVGFVHARLGVTPGWGATARLVRAVGTGEALRWLSTSQTRSAQDLGSFADAVGPLEPTLERFLAPLAGMEPAALHAVKRGILGESPLHRTGEEARVFAARWGGDAHRRTLGL